MRPALLSPLLLTTTACRPALPFTKLSPHEAIGDVCYADADADGFGNEAFETGCTGTAATVAGDCDDLDAAVIPDAERGELLLAPHGEQKLAATTTTYCSLGPMSHTPTGRPTP